MKHNWHCAFIILAGGLSSRFGTKKELSLLRDGRTALSTLLSLSSEHQCISHIHLVYNPAHQEETLQYLQYITKPHSHSPSGQTRQESVHIALEKLEKYEPDFVLIHDGARPWVSAQLIAHLCQVLPQKQAVIPAITPTETIKMINDKNEITAHLLRPDLCVSQTPQAFVFSKILSAHRQLSPKIKDCTDDAQVWSMIHSHPVSVIPGENTNKKITFKEDII